MDLVKVQEDIKLQLHKSKINFKKSPKERLTKNAVEFRMQTIDSKWEVFCKNHYEIISQKETADSKTYLETDMYGETEEFYLEFKAELKGMIDKLGEHTSSKSEKDGVAQETYKSVKLPKISIPTFSGLYSEWHSFRDLFVSLIHNNTGIDNVQKLQYLKGHLCGEAAQLIQHVPITNDNYQQCWSLLDHRYNNKQYLANCILKQFFSQRSIQSESATAIKQLLDNTTNMLHSLSNLGIDTKSWDVIVIYIVSMKLDNESRKNWEAKVSELTNHSDKLPNLDHFIEFLEKRYHSLEFLDPKLQNNCNKSKPQSNNAKTVGGVHSCHVAQQTSCVFCKRDHRISSCKDFINLTGNNRRNFVQDNKLCFNCLATNHSARNCRSTTSCRICHRRHHSLLHLSSVSQATDHKETVEKRPSEGATVAQVAQISISSEDDTPTKSSFLSRGLHQYSLLATAIVDAESSAGSTSQLRALIDPASHLSFVTEAVVQFLGLKRTHIRENLSGLGGEPSVVARAKTEVILHSSQDPQCTIRVEAYILEKLTGLLPPRKVEIEAWPKLDSLKLADPEFNIPNKIDLLLGSDVYGLILKEGLIKGPSGSLLAQETIFGWILSGRNKSESASGNMVSMHVCADDLLKSFWELEEAPKPAKRMLSEEEQRCEDIFSSTTTRDESGRYIVKLPLKNENPACLKGQSRDIALKRFLSLERKLEKEPHLKTEYKKTFEEYLNTNHMEAVNKEDYNKGVYLPYHAVIREDKQTTKVRVVFDASCKGSNQVSLNDDLMVGPVLQPELRHLIMRWRTYSICFTADIVKMYRQVKVDPSDANFQRILWRENPNDDIREYRLLRVTFGTSSAPYLAVRALIQLAIDEGEKYPLAAERVKRDFYMDDFMSGSESVPEAIEIYKQMNGLLKAGGFTMQKWFSNDETVAEAMQEEAIVEETEKKNLIEEAETNKILGLTWNRRHDEFEYAVKLPPRSEPVTKRKVISDISRLYDPLGWISPSIIKAKAFIQKLWISGLGWDEELPKELYEEWIRYREDLEQLSNFRLPRWMMCTSNDQLELHGFCDASNAAYGAVIYLRVVHSTGQVHVSLVTAKTRVAPVKQISIPRLELCGGVLVAKLLTEVSEVLAIPKSNLHAWTDSEVVLAWLSGHPNRWKTFVGNRVSEIMSHLDRHQWAYVKSSQNPADCASRGVNPSDISSHDLWLNGPDWLKNDVLEYVNPRKCQTNLDEKGPLVHVATTDHSDDNMWVKFSSLTKLLRVVAYCRRFLKQKRVNHTYLLKEEINEALDIMILKSQKQYFREEIDNLNNKKEINKKSTLTSLNPFLDELGVLRVGGRITCSQVNYDQKHPILIPHDSYLAKLLIADAHLRTLHGGPQLMLNYLRTRYWIVGAKTLIRFHFRNCVTCTRYRTQKNNPLMGQLPAERVSATRAFLFSGVDYAGPINIRVSKGRGNKSYKGYICLFVCMSTKAIHLEAVSDLSSQGFLSAFRRFVARRGHCSDLYSDNGTNFVGAARDLKELFEEERRFVPEVSDWLATNGTAWHFIPPHCPNFGGLWEAGVKSTKNHLRRTIGNSTLTFEEMSTVLSQIEACLNSRPISQVSSNPEDPIPLTPGHFLVGEPLVLPPDRRYEQSTLSTLRRWQLCQRMVQEFWKRWSEEYLMHLMHRYKWQFAVPEPEVGAIVLVKEDGLPPARWLMAKIVKKHPGVDKVTRVVTLRCKDSLFKRPVSKLCILPTTM